MSDRADALILPGDSAVPEIELKKSVLFFDSVTIANHKDVALVNESEVEEKFPGAVIRWSARNEFPREPDYVPKLEHLLANASALRKKGILRLTPERSFPYLDPGMNYMLWHSAITDPVLVEAAVPDRHASAKPNLGVRGYMRGMVMSQSGFKSKYTISEPREAVKLEGVDEFWSLYSHLRIGRFLKFVRLSHGLSLIPLAFDNANQNLLAASTKSSPPVNTTQQTVASLPSMAMHLDIFDSDALASALNSMSWDDVTDLRNALRPGVQTLREEMFKMVRRSRGIDQFDIESYRIQLDKLKIQFEEKKEKVAEAWEKLRIATVEKAAAVPQHQL